ncbi:MAG: hypothetical protein KAW12_10890 [Candidatus Aminicenantes bacterium]|nr:hypothetical protein [Candidatus Aminicenantes bacterium]
MKLKNCFILALVLVFLGASFLLADEKNSTEKRCNECKDGKIEVNCNVCKGKGKIWEVTDEKIEYGCRGLSIGPAYVAGVAFGPEAAVGAYVATKKICVSGLKDMREKQGKYVDCSNPNCSNGKVKKKCDKCGGDGKLD